MKTTVNLAGTTYHVQYSILGGAVTLEDVKAEQNKKLVNVSISTMHPAVEKLMKERLSKAA